MLSFAVAASAPAPAPQAKSLYDQVISNPDPNNGFEDYIRAADLVNDGFARSYYAWQPGTYDRLAANESGMSALDRERLRLAKELDQVGYLGVQTAMETRYASALDFVRTGNQKRVWDPRKATFSMSLPETTVLRNLIELCNAAAYADYAKGNSKLGTRDLLDGLMLAENLEPLSMIDFHMGLAWEMLLMNRFANCLTSLSEGDAREVVAFVDRQIANPPAFLSALKLQRDVTIASIDEVVGPRPETKDPTPSEEFSKRMTPSERQQAKIAIVDGANRRYSELVQLLSGPESQWYTQAGDQPDLYAPVQSVDDFVRYEVGMFGASGSLATLVRERAQMRLLGLHARVIDYRWRHNALPRTLKDVASPAQIKDPISDEDFAYEPNADGTYRLYSKGNKQTGTIELRYKWSRNGGNGQVPPPAEALSIGGRK
ncbi:MAG TPA: hypothetical protein VG820_03910 [Fimbriimonadaceae bacterium]|nr:hypothetical protein [Fimbriimonadaceae bacterium]